MGKALSTRRRSRRAADISWPISRLETQVDITKENADITGNGDYEDIDQYVHALPFRQNDSTDGVNVKGSSVEDYYDYTYGGVKRAAAKDGVAKSIEPLPPRRHQSLADDERECQYLAHPTLPSNVYQRLVPTEEEQLERRRRAIPASYVSSAVRDSAFSSGSSGASSSLPPTQRSSCASVGALPEKRATRSQDPLYDIEYMVGVFRPLIVESVKVMEVLPYLPFIEDRDVFLNKEKESGRAAMDLLLDRLEASIEPGKWQTFLSALKTVGYQYVVNILRGETEMDHTVHKNLIRIFSPEIINNIDTSEFVDHLYEREVIGDLDKEEIQCEQRNRGQIAAAFMILDRIPRRLEGWYTEFLEVLRMCNMANLADAMDVPNPDSHQSFAASTGFNSTTFVPYSNYLSPIDSEDEDDECTRIKKVGSLPTRKDKTHQHWLNKDRGKPDSIPSITIGTADVNMTEAADFAPPLPPRGPAQDSRRSSCMSEESHRSIPERPSQLAWLQLHRDRLKQRRDELKQTKELEDEINMYQKEIDALLSGEPMNTNDVERPTGDAMEHTYVDFQEEHSEPKTEEEAHPDVNGNDDRVISDSNESPSAAVNGDIETDEQRLTTALAEVLRSHISEELEARLQAPLEELKNQSALLQRLLQTNAIYGGLGQRTRLPSGGYICMPPSSHGLRRNNSSYISTSDYGSMSYVPVSFQEDEVQYV